MSQQKCPGQEWLLFWSSYSTKRSWRGLRCWYQLFSAFSPGIAIYIYVHSHTHAHIHIMYYPLAMLWGFNKSSVYKVCFFAQHSCGILFNKRAFSVCDVCLVGQFKGFNACAVLLVVHCILDVWRHQPSRGIWSTPNSFSSVFSSASARSSPHRADLSARVCFHWKRLVHF